MYMYGVIVVGKKHIEGNSTIMQAGFMQENIHVFKH